MMNATVPLAQPTAVPNNPDDIRKRYSKKLYQLGMTELIFGIVFICAWIASLGFAIGVTNQGPASSYYYNTFAIVYVSPGIWCEIFPIISGILGICAKKNTSSCMYGANMTMAIFTAIFMVILLGFSVTSAIVVSHPAIVAFQILNSVGSFVVFVVVIVHSAYCCGGICCLPGSHVQTVYTRQVVPGPGQQYVRMANGQYMLIQGQPVVQGYSAPPAPGFTPAVQPQPQVFNPATPSVPGYPTPQYQPIKQWDHGASNVNASAPPAYDSINQSENPDIPPQQ